MKRLSALILPFAAFCALSTGTLAQSSPAPAPADTAAGAHRHAVVERRIAELRDKLKITPPEQPAFDTFAGVMRANADRAEGAVQERRRTLATMSAVEQMKSYEDMARAHLDDMQRLVPAFERLYGELSPDQKKLADLSFRDFARNGGRGRG